MAAALVLAPSVALAHGGNPAEANIIAPTSMCPIASDGRSFEWVDADSPAPSGPSTIDFYATRVMPPTFLRDFFPPELERLEVATDILEPDLENELFWDTSGVDTGVYWIWSRVTEPPDEMSPELIGISPVPFIVHHEGDPIPSAIAITRPNNEFSVADQTYRVEYEAFDPTGRGRVRLEARPFTEDDWHVIADRLPAVLDGQFNWTTAALPPGDWILRATLTNCDDTSVVTHTRFVFNVSHPGGPTWDAGWDLDAGRPDAVVPDWCYEDPLDAGLAQCGVSLRPRDGGQTVGPEPSDPNGCDCSSHTRRSSSWWWVLGFLVLLPSRRTS